MVKTEEKSVYPRIGNTGVQNTSESGLRALVDWVSVTLKNVPDVHTIYDILGLDSGRFVDAPHGQNGYLDQVRFGAIKINYNGRPDMGINVEMSGEGCRLFELHSSMDWSMFFALLFNFDVNFTRLDIAIDDFDNYLSMDTIKRKLKDAAVRSRFKFTREMTKRKISDASERGNTIYFGSEQSEISVRFYDKKLERESKGLQVTEDVEHWVRCELQLRKERANKAAYLIANEYEDVGELAKGVLANYIMFLVKKEDSNKSRWPIARFWQKFLDDVDKLSLSQKAPDKTVERSFNWINKQVTATMAMLYEAADRNEEFLTEILEDGYSKLTVDHLDMIERYRELPEHAKVELFRNKKESSGNEDSSEH